MDKLTEVSRYIHENAKDLANKIVEFNLEKLDFEVPEEIVTKSISYQEDFLLFLSQAIIYKNEEEVAKGFIDWNEAHAHREETVLLDKVSSLIKPYPEIRLLFTEIMFDISGNHGLSLEEFKLIISRMNYAFDISLTESIIFYEEYRTEIATKNRKEFLELSAPIVPVQNGLAVLPLIGTIDSERAEHLMRNVIPKFPQLEVNELILDFSGVANIDLDAAEHVFNIHKVLELLGIKAIITGLRPQLARDIISRGINFNSIRTYSTVQQALVDLKKDKF
ncbi:hypothetical protein AM500_20035 [Bacillus sp. FJAT-18017]|uniref:STAS domain-containing protein n=1 Tax=Bacillus sp. FJAT-18017 TaxID=1705566 RepID=UPI0006AFBC29|nr:STAS domain-containing protein [Bacillus sp. FJAT-18017]ALC91820.1 hypothetical protein AM500_20035 [Bacillus sp. FJAT-18017]